MAAADSPERATGAIEMLSMNSTAEDAVTERLDREATHSPAVAPVALVSPGSSYYTSVFFVGSVVAIGLSAAAGIASYTLPTSILTSINDDIGPSDSIHSFSVVALVAQAVVQPILGRLSDLFGRRYPFVAASYLACIATLVCLRAQTVNALIVGNCLLGIASAAQWSFPYLITEIVPIKWRFYAMAYVYTLSIPFAAFGPVISNNLLYYMASGWRSVYFLLLMLNIAASLCFALFYYPPDFERKHAADNRSRKRILAEFDYVGLVLFVSGFTVLLLGLCWGDVLYPWNSTQVITAIVVGTVLVVTFIGWERNGPVKEPLVPMRMFRQHLTWNASVLCMSMGASMYSASNTIQPQQIVALYSDSAGTSNISWISCASSGPYLLGTISSLVVARHARKLELLNVTATVFATIFLASVAFIDAHNNTTVLVLFIIGNFFTGWLIGIAEAFVSIALRDQDQIGIAVGIAASIRSFFATLATAIFATILQSRLARNISKLVVPAIVSAGLPTDKVEVYLDHLKAGDSLMLEFIADGNLQVIRAGAEAYKVACAGAYSTVFLCTIVFGCLAVLYAFGMPGRMSDLMTNKVTAPIYAPCG
ncbi:MAG: hypothetical protein M1822_003207 [Bathelium mastoideum]|nr:MAG: hypothetical protein M1822_003207 [Bathelium mastoideum]